MFTDQLDAIPSDYSVLLWDARCHGKSTSDQPFTFDDATSDLLLILQKESIARAVFIGQSMGGNIAQEIAMIHPELVEGLVIIDATRNAQTMTAIEKFYVRITPALLKMYPRQTLINQTAKACGLKPTTQAYVKECFERMEPASFINVMSSLLTCIKPNESYREPCPVLLICGDHDRSGNIMRIMKQWPGQTVNLIKNAGHNSNQDQPEAVNKLIVGFLERDA
jgi:pimeloyl-ACP methyl ester carboxylesterase